MRPRYNKLLEIKQIEKNRSGLTGGQLWDWYGTKIPYRNVLQYNYIDLEKYYIVNFYCATQNESAIAKEFIEKYNGKYFASESKIL